MSDINSNIKNLDDKEFKKNLENNKDIVDMGTITLEKETDWEKVYRYIDALKEGDEFYRPEGLKIRKNN